MRRTPVTANVRGEDELMNGKDVINKIRTAVKDVKQKNQDVISIDALLNYLDVLERDASEVDSLDNRQHQSNLEVYRAENERNIAQYNAQQLHAVEMFRSIISYGAAALKSAILINGGAAAALLAFISNIWNKGIAQAAVTPLTGAIVFFSFGVLSSAVGTACSYFTQYYYGGNYQRTAVVFHTLTVIFVVGSYALFSLGIVGTYDSFSVHFAHNK